MSTFRTLEQAQFAGKRVLLRAGFDVPIEDGVVVDASRIDAIAPTMRAIVDAGGRLVILAHQGRPKGTRDAAFSQRPLVPVLARVLERDVAFCEDVTGDDAIAATQALRNGDVLLVENLRFDAGEERNDPAFAAKLAQLGDIYVNDAFSNAHRAHASMVGLPALLPSYMGLQLQREVEALTLGVENPAHPVVLIVSGVKLETKVAVLERFVRQGDEILLGGAIANAFLAASGVRIGTSLCDASAQATAATLLAASRQGGAAFVLPTDAVVAATVDATDHHTVSLDDAGIDSHAIFDIGPRSIAAYLACIDRAKTIIWNGPLGLFEQPRFAAATTAVARALQAAAQRGAVVLVGGGDTIDAHIRYDLPLDRYTFVSTGGGAMLSFIGGEDMPAIDALRL